MDVIGGVGMGVGVVGCLIILLIGKFFLKLVFLILVFCVGWVIMGLVGWKLGLLIRGFFLGIWVLGVVGGGMKVFVGYFIFFRNFWK